LSLRSGQCHGDHHSPPLPGEAGRPASEHG
jgi:hypothetical protein